MSWRPATNPSRWLARLPPWLRKLVGRSLILLAIGSVAVLILALVYGGLAMHFDLDEIEAMPARTTVLDRNGAELDAGYGVKRRIINRDQVPPFLVDALLSREDMRFFDHHGTDLRGLARAALRNLKDWNFTQGASTITMQLARNTFDMRAKSLHRKFLEIALTLRIENRFSKDEILVHYLNRIYFGAGCYGVEEAAQTYFGESTASLHPGECALLVGIIRGPHAFSPFRDLPAALAQRDQVLRRMVTCDFIDQARCEEITATPIVLVPNEQRRPERSYALQHVRRELDVIVSQRDITEGGLKISTTLNASWQIRLEQAIAEAMTELESGSDWKHPTHQQHQTGNPTAYLQVAAVTLETNTGAILALMGGRDFLDSPFFDHSTGARRDLGSAFEPFVGAAAAERSKLFLPGKPVQTGRQLGPAEVERIARRCGLGGPFKDTEDLYRGAAAATPMELAIALAVIGNQGKRPQPFLIDNIDDRSGRSLYESKADLSPALSPDTTAEILSLFRREETTRVFVGSSMSAHDGWLLRLGPSGSTAVWIGFDSSEKITSRSKLDEFLEKLAVRLANL